jgi:hypothetical protein
MDGWTSSLWSWMPLRGLEEKARRFFFFKGTSWRGCI